jgi:response regulator RpfG family c-di-GMP phosphodiesterase
MTGADLPDGLRLLCVDDEPNILSSLRRLFRQLGCEVLAAASGEAGLALLEEQEVDLVISDMRMPGMDGAAFVEHVRERWPQTMRMVLTGHADVGLILDAVNRGEIHRYITKPWDDHEMLLAVRHALERVSLERETARLEALTRQQNEELRALNASLEDKVAQRTAALVRMHQDLLSANGKLKGSLLSSIKLLSSIIEMRAGRLAGNARQVADLARRIAQRMGLDAGEAQTAFIAGLLHNLGKIAFDDQLLAVPVSSMNGEQLGQYRKYPVAGEQLMMPLPELHDAALLVRAHQERFDGTGFPDGRAGFDIPIGARILAVASDYFNLQIGVLQRSCLPAEQAAALILEDRARRYDHDVVAAFQDVISGRVAVDPVRDEALSLVQLRPGMVISRDLLRRDGMLLLSADSMLTERLIRQLADFEKLAGAGLTVHIRTDKGNA